MGHISASRSKIYSSFLLLIAVLISIATSSVAASKQKLIDMTFFFSKESIYWLTDKPFTPTVVFKGISDGGYWYASNHYAASEHGGTHVAAPIHLTRTFAT